MRLTLRTLLAWLDDTLSPAEVREIGRQVSDSPFAKDLVEKIHRVTRQRRLTVPPQTGPEAVDANVVASYLDNELEPDLVSELEKKCLTSDVHLAEVASVHQILSLIGQKAKVPFEARRRMYQLVKGREAVKPRAPRASHQQEPEPVSEPVQPWVTPPPPRRPWVEQYGPVAAVLALILVLTWSAWKTLTPSDSAPRFVPPVAANAVAGEPTLAPSNPTAPTPAAPAPAAAAAAPAAAAEAVAAAPAKGEEAKKEAAATKGETVAAAETSKERGAEQAAPEPEAKAKAKAKAGADVPAGAVGLAKKPAGLLLRYNPDRREWERLTDAAGLRDQDRLLSLAPFRSQVEIGTANVDLVGETEVWANATPPTFAARLTIAQGRVVLHGTSPSLPFEVVFGNKTVKVLPPPGGAVGVERFNRRAPGEPAAAGSVLRFFAAEGPVTLNSAKNEETLEGPGAVTVEPGGTFSDKVAKAAPSWVTETDLRPFEKMIGEKLLKSFSSGRPVVTNLVEALDDEQKDVAVLATSGLRAVGDISFIVPLLNKRGTPTAPTIRRAAIAVLRAFLAQDPSSVKLLREQLKSDLGDEQAATAEKLLVGYTPKEAKDPATYRKLVQILGTTDESEVGLRQLALDNLMTLTGRDDLEYDPEDTSAEGKGLKAWRDLEKAGDLKPAAAPGA